VRSFVVPFFGTLIQEPGFSTWQVFNMSFRVMSRVDRSIITSFLIIVSMFHQGNLEVQLVSSRRVLDFLCDNFDLASSGVLRRLLVNPDMTLAAMSSLGP
jgi:hypothetical protein